MKIPVLLLLVATLAPAGAGAGQPYKWTDEKGQVHYSDVVPKDRKAGSKPVDTDAPPSEADRKLAEERLARDREILEQAGIGAAATSGSAVPAARGSPHKAASSAESSCDEAWKAYNDSSACFDPYRMSEGRVKQEAFQHCKQVAQPSRCPEPPETR
jgi:hypothetical protein